jgi:alcohol dehydrogenase (cytochrome c)
MRVIVVIVIFVAAAVGTVVAQSGPSGGTLANWASYGGTSFAWRYSALDQINTANVKNLAPVWVFQTGEYTDGLQSTPIVVDGVMYSSTARNQVFAVDAATGKVIWNGTVRESLLLFLKSKPGSPVSRKTESWSAGKVPVEVSP